MSTYVKKNDGASLVVKTSIKAGKVPPAPFNPQPDPPG
jgi:hypothetical protein